ncbi:MAG: helix-turn-helix domain-containing protein [Patescibacteria group bacterium]|nr:helix-turn-helix domain-containing protein [Patescibacteria group bacterium]MDD5490867.1 helix-turn-helix domain-containing protein [Patescibacteria group bacterium]
MKPTDLEKFGLSDKEANVYLAALELGTSTVQKISGKAKLKRPTTYVIIKSLTSKGLMSSFQEGKKQFFVAENPERLNSFMENRKRELDDKKEELKKLLPELKTIYNAAEGKPTVKFYEGKEGLLMMVEEFLESDIKEAMMIYSNDLVEKVFTEKERADARERRAHKQIRVQSIYTSAAAERLPSKFSERKRIPENKFPLFCDITIFADKVRIASLGDRLSGIIIQDKAIAETLKSIFKLAWEGAEKYNQSKT